MHTLRSTKMGFRYTSCSTFVESKPQPQDCQTIVVNRLQAPVLPLPHLCERSTWYDDTPYIRERRVPLESLHSWVTSYEQQCNTHQLLINT